MRIKLAIILIGRRRKRSASTFGDRNVFLTYGRYLSWFGTLKLYSASLLLLLLAVLLSVPVSAYGEASGHVSLNSIISNSPSTQPCTSGQASNRTLRIQIECAVTPSDDAYVDNLSPSTPIGNVGVLIVQNTPSIPRSRNYAFMKFNLALTLPEALVESRARPTSATLWLYVRYLNAFNNATVEAHRGLNNDWYESNITWDSMPAIDPGNYSVQDITRNGTWVHWDVTNLVNESLTQAEQVTLVVMSSKAAWKNYAWFDSKDYALDNQTTAPKLILTFAEPQVTILTPYPTLSIALDGVLKASSQNGNLTEMLPWGMHSISIPTIVPIGNGTRGYFEEWRDNISSPNRTLELGNDQVFQAIYETQYELDASSSYGFINGNGWFRAGSVANVTVAPLGMPAEGVEGWLGVRYVFDHWAGACSSSAQICRIPMDAPNTVTANWRIDYSLSAILLLIFALIVATLVLIHPRTKSTHSISNRRRRTSRRM